MPISDWCCLCCVTSKAAHHGCSVGWISLLVESLIPIVIHMMLVADAEIKALMGMIATIDLRQAAREVEAAAAADKARLQTKQFVAWLGELDDEHRHGLEVASRMIQRVNRGRVARLRVAVQRKELSAAIYQHVLSFDLNGNGFVDKHEFKAYLKAVGEWGTDPLYQEMEWIQSWPLVCDLLGVADISKGLDMNAFFRYSERYRKELLRSDLAVLRGESVFGFDQSRYDVGQQQQSEQQAQQPTQPERPRRPPPPASSEAALLAYQQASQAMSHASSQRVGIMGDGAPRPPAEMYRVAAEHYRRSASLGHGEPARCLTAAGMALELAEELQPAVAAFSDALAADAEHAKALLGRASVYRKMMRFDDAARDVAAAQQLSARLGAGELQAALRQDCAAVAIQKRVKARSGRREFERMLWVASRLQALVRRSRREQRRKRQRAELRGATRIQAVIRGHLLRRRIAEHWPEQALLLRDARAERLMSENAVRRRSVPAPPFRGDPRQTFALAGQAVQRREFVVAAEAYLRAMHEGHARPSRCLNGAGIAYTMAGDHRRAFEQLTASIDLDPRGEMKRCCRPRPGHARACGPVPRPAPLAAFGTGRSRLCGELTAGSGPMAVAW
jgi:tetratricopeptide (TPR) repeat protein